MAVHLTKEELKDAYAEAERFTIDWQKPFSEYERIAGNKISELISKNMPKVNDGSLAASLLETPMQVLPSMQSGKFTSLTRKDAWVNEIANIIFRTKILPNANTQATFFDKEQMALYRALKYGAQPRYNFFVSNENYTGSDWSLPYIKNVKLEPGKYSIEDCDYVFLDIYFTKLQLKKLIDDQKNEVKLAKKEKRDPDTSWNVKSLQKLVDMAKTSKETDDQNINERNKSVSASGVKTTACFNRGADAPFYMFSKHLTGDELIREWKNPDPTGDLPITMQYCYETLESPYGIGRVELAGPTQNVLDFLTQAHVLATQIGLQPPNKLMGPSSDAKLSSIVYAPNALWELGQAQVETVQTSSSVYAQFAPNFGLYKSQLQTLQGRTDGSVSAESGNPQFSKTPAGIKQQETRTNSQDNYLRNKADTASAKMIQKMMNIHMAQMQGADILDIADDDKSRLEKAGYFDDNKETPEPSLSEIEILYDDLRETFRFEYDARPESDQDEKDRWVELIDIVTSNPNIIPAIQQDGYEFSIGEAMKKVISNSGADGWDKVLTKIDPEKGGSIDPQTGQPMQPEIDPATGQPIDPNAGQPVDPQAGMMDEAHKMDMTAKVQDMAHKEELHGAKLDKLQLPAQTTSQEAPQGTQTPEDTPEFTPEQINAVMEHYGADENMARFILDAGSRGYTEDEIAEVLRQSQEGVTNGQR